METTSTWMIRLGVNSFGWPVPPPSSSPPCARGHFCINPPHVFWPWTTLSASYSTVVWWCNIVVVAAVEHVLLVDSWWWALSHRWWVPVSVPTLQCQWCAVSTVRHERQLTWEIHRCVQSSATTTAAAWCKSVTCQFDDYCCRQNNSSCTPAHVHLRCTPVMYTLGYLSLLAWCQDWKTL